MSRQSVTTNTRSAARVETPRDSPDIHWTPSGIFERHFWKQRDVQKFNTEMLCVIVITLPIPIHNQVFIYRQVSSESDGHKQHQHREGRTVWHSHLKVPGRKGENKSLMMSEWRCLHGADGLNFTSVTWMCECDCDSLFRDEHLDGEKSDEDHSYAAYWLV